MELSIVNYPYALYVFLVQLSYKINRLYLKICATYETPVKVYTTVPP